MAAQHPPISFYWVPGCGNCTRLKGYLSSRGIAFDAINVQSDPAIMDTLFDAGQRAFPAIRIGEAWVGTDESEIDAALGLVPTPNLRSPSAAMLIERAARMLILSAELAPHLPPENFDDPTPTMADFATASRFLANGEPYIPHGTSKSLVHHIAQHGTKAWRLMLASSGAYELGFAIDGSGDYSFFGEPEPGTPMYRVAAGMRLTASDMRAWLDQPWSEAGFAREIETHRGPRTMVQYLRVQTVGLIQHTRQLINILVQLGIAVETRVTQEDLDGLNMPAGIWE